VGLPVPFLLAYAPNWSWVVGANALLGLNQGLCWSMTVIMKIDLAGPRRRGFAMGLNESAGYGAVAIAAWAGAILATDLGLRMALFAGGLTCAATGLVLSAAFVHDTRAHGESESALREDCAGLPPRSFRRVFVETTATDRNLSSATQAGLVNNLNDGVAWGLFPLLFAAGGSSLRQVGALAAVYPAVWSAAQLASGVLSDRWGRKWLIAAGMWIQALGIALTAVASTWREPGAGWLTGSVLLGLGTALVYPTLLASIGDAACPAWRPATLGVYRLWRDLGYVVGAIVCGVTADLLGLQPAIHLAALLTCASGILVAVRMKE
jgi:MFS family permease